MTVTRDDQGAWISFDETIASHHDLVFHCLTQPDGLTRWFPVAAEVDLRVGGTITLGWDEKMRGKTTIAILDFDPAGKITWDWFAGGGDAHVPVHWHVEPSVEDGSILHFRQGPFALDTDSLLAMAGEAQSWRWRVCNLRGNLEAKHDMRKVRPL